MLLGGDGSKRGINDLRHPQYILNQENWEKWRLTYLGGSRFMKRYLRKHSRREDDIDFNDRRFVSYVPAFAKTAINEVKNSIFQRFTDITREGGSQSYRDAIAGVSSGVDKLGSTMNAFIGRDILPELLTMARVGVYVDMPSLDGSTIADVKLSGIRPYLYWYKAEDIRSWCLQDGSTGNPTEFTALLLRDSTYDIDQHWVLPYEVTTRYRYLWIDPETGYVNCQFYTQDGDNIEPDGYAVGEIFTLPIKRIPFVMLELSDSLLSDAADYQIALLNLASSDMGYALKANYPFYTEQFDPRSNSPYLKQPSTVATSQTSIDPLNASLLVNQEKSTELRLGTSQGRRYPLGAERPAFIHPSSEPLVVSMKKQEQLKEEIKQLVSLSISNLTPRAGSSASDQNQTPMEAGLSYIGLELAHAERKIADFWAMYEGEEKATIHYPEHYSLMDDKDRREQTNSLKELMPMVPSITFRREVAKNIVDLTLGVKVDAATLRKIKDEIDRDPVVLGDPDVIEKDVVNGLVDLETASRARGYPAGVVQKAKNDHAERLARIAAAQSPAASGDPGARGVPDLSANPNAGIEEKTASQKDQTGKGEVKDRTRGEGN